MDATDRAPYHYTEKRIAQLTLFIGGVAAIGAWSLFSIRVGLGVLIGALLAWVNFRWLKNGLDAIAQISMAQATAEKPRLPIGSIVALLGRYSLIAALVCVIFIFFKIPVLSMLVGLCALGAATMLASLYEVIHTWE